MDTTVTATTPQTVTSRPSDLVRLLLKENAPPADDIRCQMRWLGVDDGTLVELRTIEPEARAITRSIDKVVELSSSLTMKNRFGRIEEFIPQGVYLYPNALIPSMAASSDADLWLAASTVKISSTKDKFENRRSFYFDFDTEREGGISVSATGPELGRTMRGALDRLDELAAVVGADNLMFMMSGNGVQVWVRLANIPETPALEQLVHRILKYTSAAWSCPDYKIDVGVFEANRLAPLGGTVKRKGANYCPVDLPKEQHRPHRMVRVVPVGSPMPVGITFEQLEQLADYMKAKLTDADMKTFDAEIDKKAKHTTAKATVNGTTSTSTTNGASTKTSVEAGAANGLPTQDVMSALGLASGDGKLTCPKCGGTEDNSIDRGGFKCFRTNNCTAPFLSNLKLVAVHEFGSDDLKNGVFKKSYEWLKEKFPQLPPLPPKEYRTPMSGPGMSVVDDDITGADVNIPVEVEVNSALRYHCTDTGNGLRLVDQFATGLRYCPESSMWLVWTGKYWAWDTGTLLVQERMKEVVVGIHKEADAITDDEQREAMKNFAYKSEATRSIEAAIKNAKSDSGIRVGLADLDSNPDLANFNNGTLDLNTCTMRPHDPKDLLTTLIGFDYDIEATAPKFLALLARAKPDSEEQAFRLRRLGQYLSGRPDKSFVISWGPKDTAKSTYYQTVAGVLGPYAARVPRSVVERSFHEQHPAQLMTMKGKRLCFGAEIRENMDTDRIKELTGESDIPARGMGENWITIPRTWKLEVYSNDKPKLDFTADDGMATRVVFDPWLVTIPKEEHDLPPIRWTV